MDPLFAFKQLINFVAASLGLKLKSYHSQIDPLSIINIFYHLPLEMNYPTLTQELFLDTQGYLFESS